VKSPLQRVAWYTGIAGLGAVAAILVGVIIDAVGGKGTDRATGVGTRPVEYLYLDEPRVRAYLSQIDFGAATQVTRVESLTKTVGGRAAAGAVFELSASAQNTRSVERVLTPTGVSAFVELEARLGLTELNLNDPTELLRQHDRLREGDLVKIKSRKLLFPHYIAPYIVVRQFATLNALFPHRDVARRHARQFARRIGPNPRITFALQALVGRALVRYLLPLEYAGLANERSLFSGGTLTVVGKVVRIFRLRSTSARTAYRDLATRETWREPLRRMPRTLYERISTARRLVRDCRDLRLGLARDCLRRALHRQTTVPGPGAVILPLAIYK
jgi:hypothetical protein